MDDDTSPLTNAASAPSATRKDLQLGRRLLHLTNGVVIASAYALLFTHERVIHLFGAIACLVYILDRMRMHYPELIERLPALNRALFRAEEQFKESAMTPYAISILLTLITFPKAIALIAIYTLAIADPLSALVGIRHGRHHLVPEKSVEGSLAFLAATLAIAVAVLYPAIAAGSTWPALIGGSFVIAFAGAVFEALPLRIDDNLTIPLFVGTVAWIVCGVLGVSVA